MLFVPKPDGLVRMCIDYRGLNKITVRTKLPMPRTDDLLQNLAGATHFSALDLAAGYQQLKLQESDVPKAAFKTRFGEFEWRVLPFGLTIAPAVFQQAMNRIFGSHLCKCVYGYFDILTISRSEEGRFRHLEMVLQNAQAAIICSQNKEMRILQAWTQVSWARCVRGWGETMPKQVETIGSWPTLSSVHEVSQLLGIANYFHKFIRDYAAMTSPLTDLPKGLSKQDRVSVRSRFLHQDPDEVSASARAFAARWTADCDTTLTAVRQPLTSAPVLVLPDYAKHISLVSDACRSPPAVGAALLQDGHPLFHFSRKVSGPELKLYSFGHCDAGSDVCPAGMALLPSRRSLHNRN